MAEQPESSSKWDSATKWIVGFTGLLVVIPALINAAVDIHKSLLKLPRTDSEKVNVELFKKYFGKSPIGSYPLQIKNKNAVYEVKFSIFDEGDVYVEYGNFTQWFPFPQDTESKTSLNLLPISMAFADDFQKVQGPYQQQDSQQGYLLYRQRTYDTGQVENLIIDMRTGQIVNYSLTSAPSNTADRISSTAIPFNGIDLDQQRSSRIANTNALSRTCQYISGPKAGQIQFFPPSVPISTPTKVFRHMKHI